MKTPEQVAESIIDRVSEIPEGGDFDNFTNWATALLAAWRDECVEVLQNMLVTRNAELKAAEAERDMLSKGVFAQGALIDDIQKQRAGLEADRDKLKDENTLYRRIAVDLQTERDVATESARMGDQRVARLVAANRELRAEVEALRKQLDYSNDWITRLVILGDEAGHQKKRNDALLQAKNMEGDHAQK